MEMIYFHAQFYWTITSFYDCGISLQIIINTHHIIITCLYLYINIYAHRSHKEYTRLHPIHLVTGRMQLLVSCREYLDVIVYMHQIKSPLIIISGEYAGRRQYQR